MDINKEINRGLNSDAVPVKIIKKGKTGSGKFPSVIVIVVVVAGLAVWGGTMLGKHSAKQEFLESAPELADTLGSDNGLAEAGKKFAQYKAVANSVYPELKPEDQLLAVEGFIKSISGNTVQLDMIDPEDRLPHLDGTPYNRQVRTVTVTSATKFTLIDSRKIDANGNVLRSAIKLSDLKTGDYILVRAGSNIRNAIDFTATEVETAK
jgi:hypothetical protein